MEKVIEGIARVDRRTKNLVKRAMPGDIAFIFHEDIDRVSAESLVKCGVSAVVNAYSFCTGTYPNQGPRILLAAGIHLVEEVGEEALEEIEEMSVVKIIGGKIYKGERLVGAGYVLTEKELEERMEKAYQNVEVELVNFAENTMQYLKKERKILFSDLSLPDIKTEIKNKSVLVVVRGHDYEHDITALKPFIRDEKPVIIAVDGGADALLEKGIKPHIIVGDMDSVSDSALKSGAELIVHAYVDGKAPGMERLKKLSMDKLAKTFPFPGTSEDAALILAYEKGAKLIAIVGSHVNLIDFLDKGRSGMASTFLTRLKVGDRLVDAKGISNLYSSRAKVSHLILVTAGALILFSAILLASESARAILKLISFKIRLLIGI